MLALLLSPAVALNGAAYGLTLWYKTLFPTLLPFMVLSNFIVYTGCARPIGNLLRPFTKALRLPEASGYCILTGFLCGYPMGAYVCGVLDETGELDNDTALFLAPFCNNVSPMFIISYICMSCLGDKSYSGKVIFILTVSAVIGMVLFRFMQLTTNGKNKRKSKYSGAEVSNGLYKAKAEKDSTENNFEENGTDNYDTGRNNVQLPTLEAFSRSVENALTASLKLCVYVMLFSTAGAMIAGLNFISDITKAVLMSVMEITAGLDRISKLDMDNQYKILMMLSATAFGGMSSVFQTMSLWLGQKFSLGRYIICKLWTAFVTAAFVLLFKISGIL